MDTMDKIRIIPRRSVALPQKLQDNICETLRKNSERISKVQLQPLEIGFGHISDSPFGPLSFKDAILNERKSQGGSIVLVLVHHRCSDGLDHAVQLFNDLWNRPGRKVAMFSVIGEKGQDLLEYNNSKLPIYHDQKWAVGQALAGDSMNSKLKNMFSRKTCKINSGSEFSRNCILIFDKKARLRFGYAEQACDELDLDAIMSAIRYIKYGASGNKRNDMSSTSSLCDMREPVSKEQRRATIKTVTEDDD